MWSLLNLFNCLTAISNQIPAICKFIRKSYRPIAQGLAASLHCDVQCFYPKLYKYLYQEANRVHSVFFQLENDLGEEVAFKKCMEGIDSLANLL